MPAAPPFLSPTRWPRAAVVATLILLAGCGRPPAAAPTSPGATAADAGFLTPPAPSTVIRRPDGGVRLAGRAPAASRVRLLSPQGEGAVAPAGPDGGWSVGFPPGREPRLFALSAEIGGRTVRGEGALAVLPAGGTASVILLRSGAAAWPVDAARSPAPRLVSFDFDAGGGFAASGSARPGATVGLALDGAQAGQGRADAAGRFAMLGIAPPIGAGEHAIAVTSADGEDRRVVTVSAAAPLAAPFRATPVPGGWRIDWAAPAGGVQSVITFDSPAGRPEPVSRVAEPAA